ncbi:hypothetical protein ACTWPF_05255 [Oceanobacillus sp. M65]|uniref:hypothetical protein n=1 Tax=Oceanobacillus sp. M65 TaxID=3457435 RepID=UPI000D11A1FB|nr:hypothetical protein OBCHQ24_14195 [Oceanobacillus iheyensis]NAP00164.1 hypothetical protein [Halomonas sp. MG34]
MTKADASVLGMFGVAILTGFCAQSIAYFLNDYLFKSYPIYYLTGTSIISLLLYLSSFVFTYIQFKKQRIEKDRMEAYFAIFGILGLLTYSWSFIVLAMWWG